jgi:hypothetical protein
MRVWLVSESDSSRESSSAHRGRQPEAALWWLTLLLGIRLVRVRTLPQTLVVHIELFFSVSPEEWWKSVLQ